MRTRDGKAAIATNWIAIYMVFLFICCGAFYWLGNITGEAAESKRFEALKCDGDYVVRIDFTNYCVTREELKEIK